MRILEVGDLGSQKLATTFRFITGGLLEQEIDNKFYLTKTIQECAKLFEILVHDHLIVAGERFFSFREEGLM